MLQANSGYTDNLSDAIKNIKTSISSCKKCHALCDLKQELCSICRNTSRDTNIIAVVEEYLDMMTIEQSWSFSWVYHILGWAISPMNWVFVWDLNFPSLLKKIHDSESNVELIIATNPNIEWEATTSYLLEEITRHKLKHKTTITRLSRWLSSGYIEYADNITLANALKERKEI